MVRKKKTKKKDTKTLNKKFTGILIILMSFFIAELLFYTWCRVQNIRIGYEITQASARHQKLVTMQNNLRVETARLKSPERISRIAREQLGLTMPSPKQIIVLP